MLKIARRYSLVSILVTSGLVIVLRMIVTTFGHSLRVRAPLDIEGCFGLASIILLAIHGRD
jgi:hypothetical protein